MPRSCILSLQLEQRLCRYFDSPHALLCPSGWEANVSLFSTLPQPDDLIIYDSLIHASVHDGLRRSQASSVPFEHNHVDHFGQVLRKHIHSLPSTANVFLAVETLYSMDGDFAPLSALLEEARAYIPSGSGRFFAFVDEAHSSGLYGAQGSGLSCEWELQNDPDVIRVCTFGKGFGASGAAILCQSDLVRQYLINYARPLIFSTAMPHAGLVLVHAALDVLESAEGEQRRRRLRSNCAHLRQELQQVLKEQGCYREVDGLLSLDREPEKHHGLDHQPSSRDQHRLVGQDQSSMVRAVCNAANLTSDRIDPGPSPIMPLLTSHADTRPLATYLQKRGFLVRPITYPTVPLGKDRIRICVHADNTAQEIQALAHAVKEWIVEHSSMLSEETRTTTRANVSSQKQHGSKL